MSYQISFCKKLAINLSQITKQFLIVIVDLALKIKVALKFKVALILTALKAKFDCTYVSSFKYMTLQYSIKFIALDALPVRY